MSQVKVAVRSEEAANSYTQTFGMSWRQWRQACSEEYAKQCEREVLHTVDFIRENEKDPERLVEVVDSKIYDNDGLVHEVCVSDKATGKANKQSIVYMHGYGAGLGFYFRNMDGLTKGVTKDFNSYFVDWLGMGNSSRPPFDIKGQTASEKVEETERFFTESLETWRIGHGIEKMILVGHSMGGYLSAVYAMQYPERVEKLLLVSPVAIPENPFASNDDAEVYNSVASSAVHAVMDEPPLSNVTNEVLQTQEETTGLEPSRPSKPKNPLPRFITFLWEQNVTPFSLLRLSGPLGPKLMSFWSSRRFSTLPPETFRALHNYCYSIFRLKGSSEYALGNLLAPGAFARRCIMNRLHMLKCRTIFMYGDKDWMDDVAGLEATNRLKEMNIEAEHHIITNAGHHCYLDNPEDFNEIVLKEIRMSLRSFSSISE